MQMETLPTYPITEFQEIDEALNILELSIRLQTGFREGFISEQCFLRKMEVNKDTHSLFNNEYFHSKIPIIKNRFSNLVLTSIGTVACAVDRALDKKFGSKNAKDRSQIGSLRSIIYMIRNAFAHDPCNPIWRCYSQYILEPYILTIDTYKSDRVIFGENVPKALTFEFDFKMLNGQGLIFEHFYALDGLFLLSEYAQKLVKTE